MDLQIRNLAETDIITVVELSGDIDGSSAPQAQESILALVQPGCKLLLDMSRVDYMSSAGLRMLLVTSRTISAKGGQLVLVGLSEDLVDTMSVTGFLDASTGIPYEETMEAGLAALGQESIR